MNIQFDAIDYAQQHEAVGVPTEQARTYAQLLNGVVNGLRNLPGNGIGPGDGCHSKAELQSALMSSEARLGRQIAEAEDRLRAQISETGRLLQTAIYEAARRRS